MSETYHDTGPPPPEYPEPAHSVCLVWDVGECHKPERMADGGRWVSSGTVDTLGSTVYFRIDWILVNFIFQSSAGFYYFFSNLHPARYYVFGSL